MPYKDKEKARNHSRQYAPEYYKSRKENGLCIKCKNSAVSLVYCLFHLEKYKAVSRRYRNTLQGKETKRKGRVIRYNKLKSENKCVTCCMPLNEESRVGILCLTCYDKAKHGI